jgi:glycosyltransferase involved in cell wall biosynthesis
MKICYLANASSIHTRRWVNYFARKGHEVHVITLNPGEGYVEGVRLHPLKMPVSGSWMGAALYKALTWIIQTRGLIRRIKPDIIDAHFITTYGYLAIASGFHPVVLTAWGSDIYLDPKESRLFRLLTKYVLRKAEITICDSESLKKELLQLGTDPAKIRLSYSGVDTRKFRPQPKNQLREKLGLKGEPVIISTRNFKWVYNIDMLIKAIPLILECVPQAKFIIAGEGDQREHLQNLAASLGVSGSVIFTGVIPHDELPGYLALSDVYISTSVSDSIQVSMQEAMACEVAPVVTDLPALRETIIDGENGFLVPVNDIQALADRVVYLLQNEEVRKRFGKLGRKLIQGTVEYRKEMDKLEKIYQEQVEKVKVRRKSKENM